MTPGTGTTIPSALNPPSFESSIFSVSPNGAAILMNPAYYATPETANALAQFYEMTAISAPGSPELPALTRWTTVQIPPFLQSGILNGQVSTMALLLDLLALPVVGQQVLVSGSYRINAGYLASYWKHNPPAEFPGLANKMCLAILKSDGAPGF